ncbi:MAG: hypothetical protein R3B54_10695 [Bdellovibrionota bacterium]
MRALRFSVLFFIFGLSVGAVEIDELREAGCPVLFVTAAQTIAQYSALSVPDAVWDLATRKGKLTEHEQRQLLIGLAQHTEDQAAWDAVMPILKEHWREIERLASQRAHAIYGDTEIPFVSLLELEIDGLTELADEWDERAVRNGVAANSPVDLVEDVLNVRVEQNLDQLHLGNAPKENANIAALTREQRVEHVAVVFQQQDKLQKSTVGYLQANPRLAIAPTLAMGDIDVDARLTHTAFRNHVDLVRYNERSEGMFPEIRLNTDHLHLFGGGSLLTFNSALKEFIRVSLINRQEIDVHYHLDHMYGLRQGDLTTAGERPTIGTWLRGVRATDLRRQVERFIALAITGQIDEGYKKSGELSSTRVRQVRSFTQAYKVTYIPEQGEKTVRFHLEFTEGN